jgi:hypothetical protein
MRCEEFDELLEELAAGDEPLAGDAASHVSSCPDCARSLTLARSIDGLLGAQPVAAVRPELMAAILATVRRERWRSEQLLDLSFNVTVAAAVILLIGGVWLLIGLSGLGGVGSDAVVVLNEGVRLAFERIRPMLPVYALATVLLVATWGLWLWAEGID